jgi:5-methylcytosine-specific restriction enzyme A
MPVRPPIHRYRRLEANSNRPHNQPRQFYHTAQWRDLRDAVLERDGYVCQVKLFGCDRVAVIADHITPRPKGVVGFNPAFDRLGNLRACCRACHPRLGVPEHQRVL